MSTDKENIDFSTSDKVTSNKILIAPLNWGLGHAARCIPIIHFLIEHNFSPVLASDGAALALLKKEFPKLEVIELPSYQIQYSEFSYFTKWKLLFSFWSIQKAVKMEQKIIADLFLDKEFVGLISDNRFGVYHQNVPSVYMTHQLNVFSGLTTWFTSKYHQKIISNFNVCWVPDVRGSKSLSGKLSKVSKIKTRIKFLGNLSRFEPNQLKKKYDVLLLLSGPEPQRSIFEKIVLKEFSSFEAKVLLVRGVLNQTVLKNVSKNIEVVNFLTSKKLEAAINMSEMIVSRSGYSTIMDLARLNKKAVFVPTPGQIEQEYLAKYLEEKKIAPFCKQGKFNLSMLSKADNYSGFVENYSSGLSSGLLQVFKSNLGSF
ncbi:glycosyltransferase [Flavicella sp.]|uniref:glycosyltransferase n=1 Tax=Flavicella sp. TaxID=2957742 RepID=UPI0030175F9B